MSARAYFAWRMCQSARLQDDRNRIANMRCKLRKIINPLDDLSEEEFRLQYRLSKIAFMHLCNELRQLTHLRASQRVSLKTKVLTALFFFASGSADEEHLYYSRKHYHSLNVQMVCDSDCRIISINAKFGGSNHDAFIWENSNLNNCMQSLHNNGEIVWLLGDSGYPQRPWIMTPITNAVQNSSEAYYNNKHLKTRVLIENTFGRLKNRWRCLNKDRVLHYSPIKAAKIIQACSVLYNLALELNVPEPEGDFERNEFTHQENIEENQITDNASTHLIRGRLLRAQLVRRFYRNVE